MDMDQILKFRAIIDSLENWLLSDPNIDAKRLRENRQGLEKPYNKLYKLQPPKKKKKNLISRDEAYHPSSKKRAVNAREETSDEDEPGTSEDLNKGPTLPGHIIFSSQSLTFKYFR